MQMKIFNDDEGKSDHFYDIYLYTTNEEGKTTLLYLDNTSIIDLNIEICTEYAKKKENNLNWRTLSIQYGDYFFDYNIRNCGHTDFSIDIICHDDSAQFLQQITLLGEDIEFEENKVLFYFTQISTNRTWASINPAFIPAIDSYKKQKMSFIRDRRINDILS